MYKQELLRSAWRKSSYSAIESVCVEVAVNSSGLVSVRDSKNVYDQELTFSPAAWTRFVNRLKASNGEAPCG